MSRWWPERVVLRLGDPPRAGALGTADESPVREASASQRGESAWAAFEQQAAQRPLARGTRVTCIVAGDCVRHVIVPWHAELRSSAQRLLLAKQCFRDTYGDSALDWTVHPGSARYGAATLGCALDTGLLTRLDGWAQSCGITLSSVQPSLMHAWNRARRGVAAGPFWFALIEPGWTTALLMSADDEPLHVKRWPAPAADLTRLLDREWFAIGTDLPHCTVYVSRVGAPSDATGARPSLQLPSQPTTPWRFFELPADPRATGLTAA